MEGILRGILSVPQNNVMELNDVMMYLKLRESLYHELLLGSMPSHTILILGRFYLGMHVLVWFTNPNDIINQNIVNNPHPTRMQAW